MVMGRSGSPAGKAGKKIKLENPWNFGTTPDNEDTVEVMLKGGGSERAWFKGIGWKTGSGTWLDRPVIAWRPLKEASG